MAKKINFYKNKLFTFIILLCAVLNLLITDVSAQEQQFTINSNEIYMKVPAEFQFCPFDLTSDYYSFKNNEGHTLYVDCLKNTYGLKKVSDITQQKAEEIVSLMFFAEGDNESLNSLNINYSSFSQTMVNGINIFVLEGSFLHVDSTDEPTGFGICFAATQESLFFISLQTSYKDFDKKDDLLLFMGDVKINGTFLEGDKPAYELNFSASAFKDVAKNDVQNSFKDYEAFISEKYAEEDAALNQQEYEEIRDDLYKGAYIISAVSVTLLIISVIFLFKKYKKKKQAKIEGTTSENK